jgi:hypothetical protein
MKTFKKFCTILGLLIVLTGLLIACDDGIPDATTTETTTSNTAKGIGRPSTWTITAATEIPISKTALKFLKSNSFSDIADLYFKVFSGGTLEWIRVLILLILLLANWSPISHQAKHVTSVFWHRHDKPFHE